LKDRNSLTPLSTNAQNLTNTYIRGESIVNHFNQTKNITSSSESNIIPTNWDYLTIMNADFNNNLSAGNVSDLFANITEIKIKRRKIGEF